MAKSTRLLLQLLILMFPACVSAQSVNGLTDLQPGSETIKQYKLDDSGQIRQIASAKQASALLTKLLPEVMQHHPQLLGISDFDGDGRTEVFIVWYVEPSSAKPVSHLQVYRIISRQAAVLVREFQIESVTPVWIDFPVMPEGRKINAAIARVLGGAKWCTYYLISPGNKSLVELGEASHLKLGDLDGDGTYEWILLQWRGSDLRCSYGFFGIGYSAKIFRLSDGKFKKVWPPSDWAVVDGDIDSEISYGHPVPRPGAGGQLVFPEWKPIPWAKTYLVQSQFYDVDDDGRNEIATITDVVTQDNLQRRLSIYKSAGDHFDCVAYVDLPSAYPAVQILGMRHLKDRKQFVLRLADAKRCNIDAHKFDEGVVIAGGFDLKDGSLKWAWVNDKIDITLWAAVKDLDDDGEEEMIFSTGENASVSAPKGTAQKRPVLLRGVKDFLPYASPRQ
jgi:hypothetical protein